MLPKQQIIVTHDGATVYLEDDTITSDVWLRENKGSNANLTVNNPSNETYLNKIEQDDVIQIKYKTDADIAAYTQVFGGYAVDLTPEGSIEGLKLPVKAYGYDIAFDRMRAAVDYGEESVNPTLDTLLEIVANTSKGLIPAYTQKVLNKNIYSGYTFDTSNVLDEATSHKYIPLPYSPINDALKITLDLISAAQHPSAGLHWTVIPDGATAYLCIDQIGNHTTAATIWPTNCPITISTGSTVKSSSYGKQQRDANYIVYFGKYEYPTGEIITENAAANWTNVLNPAVSVTDDTSDYKIGENCVYWDLGAAGAATTMYYFPLASLDISKIGSKRIVPTLSFYMKQTSLQWFKLIVGTGTPMTNYYTRTITMPSSGKWGAVEVSLGQYIKVGDEDSWTVGAGSPNWNDLDYIAFEALRPGLGASDIRLDGITFNGIVTRGAFHSLSGKYKIKLITDSLAKTTNLVASDDTGTVAQLAKAELLRAKTTPIFGIIILDALYPNILPGQIIQSLSFRITEVHHHYSGETSYTELAITDDVLNSYPQENSSFGPTQQYNAIMKAVNPDFQDRDRASLKAREIEIEQSILSKDYAESVLLLGLDEGSGTTATDESGEANDGTITGATWGTGKFGGALVFAGAEDVTIASDASLLFDTDDFAVSVWVKTSTAADQIVIGNSNASAGPKEYGYAIRFRADGHVWFQSNYNDAAEIDYEFNYSDNVWHHYVFSRTSEVLSLYIDDVLKTSAAFATAIDSTSDLVIGKISYAASNYLTGSVDDVRIYSKGVTDAEVTQLFNL